MMPHKRKGVHDLCNYHWDLRAGNLNYASDFLLRGKGKKLVSTRRRIAPYNYEPFLATFQSEKSVALSLAFPSVLGYLIVRYLSCDSTKQDRCHGEQLSLERILCRPRNQTKMIMISAVQ